MKPGAVHAALYSRFQKTVVSQALGSGVKAFAHASIRQSRRR
jgi:hypothetical protein